MRALVFFGSATLVAACSLGALDGFSGDPLDAGPTTDASTTDSVTTPTNDGAPPPSAYHAAVAADGPIAHFPLEETSGGGCASTVPTSIVCTYSADGISHAQPGIGGTTAIRVNTTMAALSVSAMPSNLGLPYSIELWLQVDVGAPTSIGAFMEDSSEGRKGFNLFVWEVGTRLRTELWSGSSALIAYGAGPSSFSGAVWHHAVITHAVGPPHTDLFYVDGTLVESANTQPNAPRPTVDSVFKLSGFVGYLDEIAIYDKALPAGRVAAHYSAH